MRIAKQPNGKYFIEHNGKRYINQTEDDYYNFALEDARYRLNTPGYTEGLDFLIQRITSDEEAKEMGFDKPLNELIKWVPKPVISRSYAPRDCTEYGKCPKCKAIVQSGIGGTDDACPKCGQRLKWSKY